jgi:sensor histidine kinase YesM
MRESGVSLNSKLKFIVLIGIPYLVFAYYYSTWKNKKFQDDYFKNFHLNMVGVIKYIDQPPSSNGVGIIGADILSTNIKDYDQRGKMDFYYCIIKNGRTELYQACTIDFEAGDTVQVNADKRLFSLKKRNGTIIIYNIFLYDNSSFYEYAKKNFQKL